MKLICYLCTFHIVVNFVQCDNENVKTLKDEFLNFSQIIEKYGYSFNEYRIVTEDGYILALYRINSKSGTDQRKEPVLLDHGLMSSSESWIFAGPKKAMAYLLADANYDVWLANSRGSMHSRKHERFNPDRDNKYWAFSWHEIGVYDLPANIDFILKTTNFPKIHYVGHSQGTTVFFVLASSRPEYNAKINVMAALAPSVFLQNMRNVFARFISPFYLMLDNLATSVSGLMEFVPFVSNKVLRSLGRSLCDGSVMPQAICVLMVNLFAGYDPEQLDASILPYVASTFPSGAATRQLLHYAQSITNGDFREYDFGTAQNRRKYNASRPPKYPLKKITTPVALFFADNDELNIEKDVRRLANILPNVVQMYRVPFKQFTHNDFVWAKDIKTLVNDEVIKLLKSRPMA